MNKEEKLHRKISKLAYKFYTMRGQKHSYDLEDWLRAEKIVKGNKWQFILGSPVAKLMVKGTVLIFSQVRDSFGMSEERRKER